MFSMLWAPTGILAEAVRGFVAVSTLHDPWPPPSLPFNRFPAMVYCGFTMITEGQVAVVDATTGALAGISPSWTVFGPRTRPVASLTLAPLRCITVILYPDAFSLLTGCNPVRLRDCNEPADACLPAEWRVWPGALQARANHPKAQIAWMAAWLERRWLTVRPRWDMQFGNLVRQAATQKPSETAEAIGLGHRRIQRQALATIGLPPIKLHRLQRAHLALAQLATSHGELDGLALASMAADLGFADQSHFTREIRDLTGLPPARLAAALAQDASYWAYRLGNPAVAFLQDERP